MSSAWRRMLEDTNIAFVVIFTAEFVIKVVGQGPALYWSDAWNRFDLFVVAASLVDVLFTFVSAAFLRIARISRVSRVIRLSKDLQGMQVHAGTIFMSLSAFWTVGALCLLVFYMYAYSGVLFFGRVRFGEHINEHCNFRDFGQASLALTRVATGEAWVGLMQEAVRAGCDEGFGQAGSGGCGGAVGVPYFVSFLVFVGMILLQLFTAIIIMNFEEREHKDKWPITEQQMHEFSTLWALHSQSKASTLEVAGLVRVFETLHEPLGLIPEAQEQRQVGTLHGAALIQLLDALDLPAPPHGEGLRFHLSLYELASRVAEVDLPKGHLKNMHDKQVAGLRSAGRAWSMGPSALRRSNVPNPRGPGTAAEEGAAEAEPYGPWKVAHVVAATAIQHHYRGHLALVFHRRSLQNLAQVGNRKRLGRARAPAQRPSSASPVSFQQRFQLLRTSVVSKFTRGAEQARIRAVTIFRPGLARVGSPTNSPESNSPTPLSPRAQSPRAPSPSARSPRS